MQLTVLGCHGPYPPAGGSCSGYLVDYNGCRILLDCGNGVLSRLQHNLKLWELDAIILSHLHADHLSDIMVLRYGLEKAYQDRLRKKPLRLYAPPGPATEFERLHYKNAYKVIPLEPGRDIEIGPFAIETTYGAHSVPALAMRIRTASSQMVYTGDTEYIDCLSAFSKGTDLLLCDANYLEQDIENGLPNHMSAAQAAALAASAGVKKLLLTHHYPGRDPAVSLAEAFKYFPEAAVAVEGRIYMI